MPLRPLVRCIDCNKAFRGTGRCPECSRRRYVDTRRVYASKAWKRLKDQVLSEEIRCYLCGEFLYGQVDVDHKIPVESRPDLAFDRSNLGAAHHWCHSQKTQREK